MIGFALGLIALGFAVEEAPALLEQLRERRLERQLEADKKERRLSGPYVSLDAMARGEGKSTIGDWEALYSALKHRPYWHVETSEYLREEGYIREDLLGLTERGGEVFLIDPRTRYSGGWLPSELRIDG